MKRVKLKDRNLENIAHNSKNNNQISKEAKKIIEMANDKTSWEKRFEAIHKMKKYDCDEIREVLIRLALHDRVYKVKKEAYKVGSELNIEQNGKKIYLGKKHTGYSSKDFKDLFVRIRKELSLEKFDLKLVKNKMKIIDPEMYDVMKCEKGKKFDYWIKDVYCNFNS